MTRKQDNSESPAGSTNERYKCPKCGGPLTRGGIAGSGKVRWTCRRQHTQGGYCYSTTNPESLDRVVDRKGGDSRTYGRALKGKKRFIITSAQNATPVHEGFLNALMKYCEEHDAELIVIPIRYKNPTSTWSKSQQNLEVWDEKIAPYLYNKRKKLCPNLMLMGDIKTIPTAQSPLTGFEGITHAESGVFGHPKVQLRTIPTPQGSLPKILTTTGAVTKKNYTDTKAGKRGEFHHTFGATVVNVRGKKFHLRQIIATNDGGFIDLDRQYFPDGSAKPAPPALGLVMGDTHVRFIDPKVDKATFGKGGIVERVNPEHLVWHDLLDGYAKNPHHDSPFIAVAKTKAGLGDMRKEVEDTIDFLINRTGNRKSVVTASNHDDFFHRWIARSDWRTDPANAEFYLRTALVMVESAKMEDYGATYIDPFVYWGEQKVDPERVRFLRPDESFMLGNSECGFHGHRGPDGAKGTVSNLSKLGVRVISGHSHSPAIEGGHYRVGTSTHLKLEYTTGPSSWLNTHCIVYANGKRTLINIIDGEAF